MLSKGPAKKVTIFINEDTPHHMGALHDAIMAFLMHKGVSGATATRASLRDTAARPRHMDRPHRAHAGRVTTRSSK
jgi:PII-like signaling protein